MGLFASKQESTLRATRRMVEEVISELGMDPGESRMPTDEGSFAWGLMKGSAEVFIFVLPGADPDAYHSIQVVSPVMTLPGDSGHQNALFRRLLELNAQVISGAAFGLKGQTVMLVCDRSTKDISASEVRDMVLRVGYFADKYDDDLVRQFGGRRHAE